MLNILVVHSDPNIPGFAQLRLNQETKVFLRHHKDLNPSVFEIVPASTVSDVRKRLAQSTYDVIHFSGHGESGGLYLEREVASQVNATEFIDSQGIGDLLTLTRHTPRLVVFMACYSSEAAKILEKAAPFVVMALGEVEDQLCIAFAEEFYPRLCRNPLAITTAFDDTIRLLRTKRMPVDNLFLARRQAKPNAKSKHQFLEVTFKPSSESDEIRVLLNPAIKQGINRFGLSIEEVIYLLERKIRIHHWIFDGNREDVLIPIGDAFLGVFDWKSPVEAIMCRSILRLEPGANPKQVEVWSMFLVSYNDLASLEYRHIASPKLRESKTLMEQALVIFDHHIDRHFRPGVGQLENLGFASLVTPFQMAISYLRLARDYCDIGTYSQTIINLELALTSLHDVVRGVQPPTSKIGG